MTSPLPFLNYPGTTGTPTQPTSTPTPGASGAGSATGGGFDSLLSSMIGTGINLYGNQNATESANRGAQAGINTQTSTLGNINNLFGAQTGLGNASFNALGSTLGINGQPANYSNFLNMPGYQFSVGAGTQAIERMASAAGNLYTPNTMTNVGQYVTGTAMQDYNTYVNQLLQSAGFGAQANNALSTANLNVGGNISQLQSNMGMNSAAGYNQGAALAGSNTSGVANGVAGLIGKGLNYLNSPSSSGGSSNSPTVGDMTGGAYNGGAFGGGAPLYDPNTGGYPGAGTDTTGGIANIGGDVFGGSGPQ